MDYFDKQNAVLFATTDCPDALGEARKYISKENLRGKITVLRHDGQLLVVVS